MGVAGSQHLVALSDPGQSIRSRALGQRAQPLLGAADVWWRRPRRTHLWAPDLTQRTSEINWARVGPNGRSRSRIRPSTGGRSALRLLQGEQAATVLVQVHRPPRLCGTRWSMV